MVFGADVNGNYIRDTSGNQEDTNFNAGVNVLRGGDPSNGSPQPVPLASSGAVTLRPGGTATSTININSNANDFLVQGVSVTVNIQHGHDADLTATLIGPDGTSVQLFSGVGTTGALPHANFTNATFSDSATTPIQLAATQGGGLGINGTYNPQFPLSAVQTTRIAWCLDPRHQ